MTTLDPDDYARGIDARLEADARLLLRLVLGSGVALLGLLGWLLTL
jgi:hypothetical protein